MNQYLVDTDFAVSNLMQLACSEENELNARRSRLMEVEAQLRMRKWDFETSDLNDDFSDAYVMAAFGRMARSAEEFQGLQQDLAHLQASIGAHQHAVQAIAGSVLQIAKQGISIVHGGFAGAPEGRKIGSLPIRDIVWQARNQAIHYEEPAARLKQPVRALFETLRAEQGPMFSLELHDGISRAKQVMDLLGWSAYERYLEDMRVLLPEVG